jgi:hypothetical protein
MSTVSYQVPISSIDSSACGLSNGAELFEYHTLAELEVVIESGKQTYVEVGNALREIRDRKLYKETHQTFEAYCQERWGFTRSTAYRNIRAADVACVAQSAGEDAPPSQAKALGTKTQREKRLDNALQQTNPEVHERWKRGDLTNDAALALAGDRARLLADSRRNRDDDPEPEVHAPISINPKSKTRILRDEFAETSGFIAGRFEIKPSDQGRQRMGRYDLYLRNLTPRGIKLIAETAKKTLAEDAKAGAA